MNRVFVLMALSLLLVACSHDDYDTGDGHYSYLRADFGMAHATGGAFDYLLTDGGDSVRFSSPVTATWATRSDSLYRVMAYYDTSSHQVFSLSEVLVVQALEPSAVPQPVTDPLTLESAWAAGGFLNIGFAVKTGRSDSIDARQQIGLLVDSVVTAADGRHAYLTVLHAQNGVPQYYTVHGFMSLPLPREAAYAQIHVRAVGYDGDRRLSVAP